MRAEAYTKASPISDEGGLIDIELDQSQPSGFDLLAKVRAVSVNPADVKRRACDDPGGQARVLGDDASRVVAAAGERATRF